MHIPISISVERLRVQRDACLFTDNDLHPSRSHAIIINGKLIGKKKKIYYFFLCIIFKVR